MLKIIAPAIAVLAAVYLLRRGHKAEEPYAAAEGERLTEMAAGAYPGE